MLIIIESVTPEDVKNDMFTIAIENILRSFAEKKHIIIGPKHFFKEIINDETGRFSLATKGYANEALRGLLEYSAISSTVSFYVSIDFKITTVDYEWITSSNLDKFRCGPLFFNDSSQLQKIRIICENPIDSDFLKIIASHYAKENNLSRCRIEFNVLNGGGGTTKDIFERTISNDEITFCVVDNDKMHPKAPFGGTSSHFVGRKTNKSGLVKILDVHEIESLIPIETIEEVLESLHLTIKKRDAMSFFKDLCAIDENVKFYYDHKKGFELSSAWKLDNKHGEFWRRILQQLSDKYECDCLKEKECDCNPSCLTYEGFGEGLLSNSLHHITRGNLMQFNPQLSPRMRDMWTDVGKSFFSWSCGPYKKARLS